MFFIVLFVFLFVFLFLVLVISYGRKSKVIAPFFVALKNHRQPCFSITLFTIWSWEFMVESISFCKGIGGVETFFSTLFSEFLLLVKEEIRFDKRSLFVAEFSLLCVFSFLPNAKKEFKRLKMPNLSILIAPKKEKITKNYCKSL